MSTPTDGWERLWWTLGGIALVVVALGLGQLVLRGPRGTAASLRHGFQSVRRLGFLGLAMLVISTLAFVTLLWSDVPSDVGYGEDESAAGGPEDGGLEMLFDGRWEFSDFWARHTLWAGLFFNLATAGIVFSLWRVSQERKALKEKEREERLALTLSSAGLAGIVDHLTDAEILITLACLPSEEDARSLMPPAKEGAPPSADWNPRKEDVRAYRERCGRERNCDVRLKDDVPTFVPQDGAVWRLSLMDLAIRRIAKAMNEWAPLITQSVAGRAALDHLAVIRLDLMQMASAPANTVREIRQRLRFLALYFEYCSGPGVTRPDVLTEGTPLGPDGTLDGLSHFPDPDDPSNELPDLWREAWKKAFDELEFTSANPGQSCPKKGLT